MKSDLMHTISNNIKKQRKISHLTQAEVAEKLALDTQYYAQLERGERNFTIEKIAILCGIFNVGIDKIIEVNNDEPPTEEMSEKYIEMIKTKLKGLDLRQLKILNRYIDEILPL